MIKTRSAFVVGFVCGLSVAASLVLFGHANEFIELAIKMVQWTAFKYLI